MNLISRIVAVLPGRTRKKPEFKSIGENCQITLGNEFIFPEKITLGNDVHIESGGFFQGQGGIEIHD